LRFRVGEQFPVQRAIGQERFVLALGHEFAFLQDKNSIGAADGCSPVRDQEGGATAAEFEHCFPDLFFGGGIYGAGCVIEEYDLGLDEQGAGDGDALALASAQGNTALSDDGVVALGQFADKPVGLGGSGGCLDLVSGSQGASEGDILC
jgi:hypothetical protein